MDSAEAREILKLYRPDSTDAADPQTAEALSLVDRDPELDHWFREHCEVYTAIRAKLKQIPVPADLKRKILVERPSTSRIIPLYNPWVLGLAAAALLMLVGVAAYFLMPDRLNTFAAYRDRMGRAAQRTYNMTMTSTNLDEIRDYLRVNHADADYALTREMGKLPGQGCAILEWHKAKVSMVCLKGADNKDLFLFVAKRSSVPNVPVSSKPEFSQVYKFMTATWTKGDRVYILASSGDATTLQKYLD
jgi:hypothetical protein